ncbi:MAG: hypothetical protein ACFFDI_14345 [Promethearchaeota archaeon]
MKRTKVFLTGIAVIITAVTFTLPVSAEEPNDSDGDGVPDYQDLCPGTTGDDLLKWHGTNRWKWDGTEWRTDRSRGQGKGPKVSYTMDQTRGCNCNQILDWLQNYDPDEFGQMLGHRKFGCSNSIMQEFLAAPKDWILPDNPIYLMLVRSPGENNTYFDLQISGVGEGYNIIDGVWPAWCADSHIFIYYYTVYEPDVRSSLDPDLGEKCEHCTDDEQWNYVNYILNHKHPEAEWWEIQAAIWYFTDDDPDYNGWRTEIADLMIADALENGADFHPQVGQLGAVILDNGPDVQLVFLEVDP